MQRDSSFETRFNTEFASDMEELEDENGNAISKMSSYEKIDTMGNSLSAFGDVRVSTSMSPRGNGRSKDSQPASSASVSDAEGIRRSGTGTSTGIGNYYPISSRGLHVRSSRKMEAASGVDDPDATANEPSPLYSDGETG